MPLAGSKTQRRFDYDEAHGTAEEEKNLIAGIIWFWNFGQFLAQCGVKHGHHVLAYSCSDYGDLATRRPGATYHRDGEDFLRMSEATISEFTSLFVSGISSSHG